MKELTDEQSLTIGRSVVAAAVAPNGAYSIGPGGLKSAGRAAYEAVRPLVLAEALAEPDGSEWYDATRYFRDESYIAPDGKAFLSCRSVSEMLRDRLAHLTAKPDADEITIVKWVHNPKRWIVLQGGWNVGNYGGFEDRRDAERYAAGLRVELAEARAA